MPVGTWPTVGREHELRAIADAIAQAHLGEGRLILVEGVAGAGKTHLLRHVLSDLDDSVVVAHAQISPAALPRPFAAPLAALRVSLGELGLSARGPRSMIEAGAGDVAQAVVVDGLLRLVEDRCVEAPHLLCIDDVHAADVGTLAWLEGLERRVESLPLAVVLGARPPIQGSPYESLHHDLCRRHVHVPLPPLGDGAVVELVRSLYGRPPGPMLADVLRRAGGLPLFLSATLAALDQRDVVVERDQVDLTVDPGDGGGSLADDAVSQRVRNMPAELRPVLLAAAVLGEAITARHVRAMLGSPLVEVLSALDAAERTGVLVVDGNTYGFRHELYRTAVLDGGSPPVIAALHAAAAEACAETSEPALVVAQHVIAAGTAGPDMVDWLVEAAEATVAFEPQNALAMAEAALRSTRDPSRLLIEVRGRALASVGRVGEAESVLRQLLGSAESAAEESRLRRELALALFQQGRPTESLVEMTRVVELAPDEVAHARARAETSFTHLLIGEFARAGEVAADVVASAAGDDPTTEVAAAMVLCLTRLYEGEMRSALELADRLEYLTALETTADATVYQPWFAAGMARVEADDHAGARRIAATGQQRCLDGGYQWMVPGYDALAAYASLRAGELPDAVAEATAALGWGIVDRLGVAVWCHAFLARVAVHQGELDVAATELAAADELIDQGRAQLGWDHVGLARAALAERQGDLAAAYASLADVWDLHLALGARSAAQETGPELVRLEALLGSDERTDAVLDVLGSSARRIGDATRLADLDRAAAWHRRDVDRLERAIAHSRRSPRRLVTATALAELATWYRADGRRSAADEAARAARELFVACGAVGDAHLVEPALRGGGAHQADATTGPAALSRREAAVVTLVAEGLANAEIATRLYVSRRTVESHVSSAYRKLGVSNRVELARIGSQLGFATGSDATAATWRSRPA